MDLKVTLASFVGIVLSFDYLTDRKVSGVYIKIPSPYNLKVQKIEKFASAQHKTQNSSFSDWKVIALCLLL